MKIECKGCGNLFEGTRRDRYCSGVCRRKADLESHRRSKARQRLIRAQAPKPEKTLQEYLCGH